MYVLFIVIAAAACLGAQRVKSKPAMWSTRIVLIGVMVAGLFGLVDRI